MVLRFIGNRHPGPHPSPPSRTHADCRLRASEQCAESHHAWFEVIAQRSYGACRRLAAPVRASNPNFGDAALGGRVLDGFGIHCSLSAVRCPLHAVPPALRIPLYQECDLSKHFGVVRDRRSVDSQLHMIFPSLERQTILVELTEAEGDGVPLPIQHQMLNVWLGALA